MEGQSNNGGNRVENCEYSQESFHSSILFLIRYLVLCSIAANRTSTLEASPYISKYINERKSLFQC